MKFLGPTGNLLILVRSVIRVCDIEFLRQGQTSKLKTKLDLLDLDYLDDIAPVVSAVPVTGFKRQRTFDGFPTCDGTNLKKAQHSPVDFCVVDIYENDCSSDQDTCGYLSEDSSPLVSSVKKRKTVNSLFEEEQLFRGNTQKGIWLEHEDRLLLHIMYALTSAELRTMAAFAWKCGVRRPRRAIEKKIKRTLHFGKWRDRKIPGIRATIGDILVDRKMQKLEEDEKARFEQVCQEFQNDFG
eukprot:CAMPEP_0203783170 /NCGR_PEP_ID=MMETSP0099_2-20121227/11523_1 /ASSEMBLY_ACC=CAM_ASM_000209 /TAXON_ID=96639 /ORGANISM=" , Strain NY0313808BC1" /LENGTH=240 /DNA_ID=CAMNT_0050684999 /DNA_START=1294 /DNA_END=2013 /DNA_ORIENTATION=-